MKKIFLLFIVVYFALQPSQSKDINLTGVFHGKNLYVLNPFASTGVGFCIYEVTVNNQLAIDDVNSSSIEIDLSVYGLLLGDKLNITIKHKDNCIPKIINPEVIRSSSTFKIESMLVDNNMLHWSTSKENGELPFIVEQFRWRKWKKVGTVTGKGTSGINTYSIGIKIHSGQNKFRVKQTDFSKKPRYSDEIIYESNKKPISFSPANPKTEITFTAETSYEIYDGYGKIVMTGFSAIIDVSRLKKGIYYINYDNRTGEFKKK